MRGNPLGMPGTQRVGGAHNPFQLRLTTPPLQSVTASVAALTKKLSELTAAKAMDVDADAPPPLQSILKKAPKYSLAKMTQRPGPVPAHPPTGEFYLDAQGQPTHPRS